ncbi:NAD-dependent deacylase [Lewinella sp. 4G2]|uniref:SIR2 family NAD-dependent protein deacylase n=1 Tax=Lewinella sp. 4G2 TaxID=1803372 RepID=UPI0007B4F427|nr:NAD-dependent deacylase [Lewinella sp. 4G2]OAV43712.1 NAD-dependent protein deacylase [Lewinella sp. 4G2]
MKKIVVLTGAGVSAESGIATFRDSNGLWENHRVEDVASPEGFARNPELVLNFYNARRAQLKTVKPNLGHHLIAELEKDYDVTVVTQNVDDLHERAGSSNIIHLHGELRKVRSVDGFEDPIPWTEDLHLGDLNDEGRQLRPHIVWFGEQVPRMDMAADVVSRADLIIIVGTSMQVYPAAGLVSYAPPHIPVIYIDPNPTINDALARRDITTIVKGGGEGMAEAVELIPGLL